VAAVTGDVEKQIPLIGPEGTHAARHALRERSSMMDNRDYPCSAMPDALCCWVFHLPPNAGLCVRYVWDSRHVTEPSERVGPRPSAIGYVAKGGIAAF
jgi:hypothetical protein